MNLIDKYCQGLTYQVYFYLPISFPPIFLNYKLNLFMNYFKLMSYELLNIIKKLYAEGKIVFYTYVYKTKSTVAIIPSDKVNFLFKKSIIQKENIIDDFDIDKEIDREYEQYLWKNLTKYKI